MHVHVVRASPTKVCEHIHTNAVSIAQRLLSNEVVLKVQDETCRRKYVHLAGRADSASKNSTRTLHEPGDRADFVLDGWIYARKCGIHARIAEFRGTSQEAHKHGLSKPGKCGHCYSRI